MSKGTRIFLVIAVVWLGLWSMGSVLFFRGAATQSVEADYLAAPLTGLARGAPVRLQGTIEQTATVSAPLSGQPCVAAVVNIYYVSTYDDAQDKTQLDSQLIATKRAGPAEIAILADGGRVALPLERWKPRSSKWEGGAQQMSSLPPSLAIPQADIDRARASARGKFSHYTMHETRFVGGTAVFVAGRLADRDDSGRLEADPVLGRIELHVGSQRDCVSELRGSSGGLRIAGWIFAALALLPLLSFGLVRLRGARRERSRSGA